MLNAADNQTITRCGPGSLVGNLFRRFWLPALVPAELPNPDSDPIRLRLLGEDLIAFRDTDGRVGIIQNNCPHRGASLFFGRNEENGLRCVYHGWKFDRTGACLDMPNEPAESDFKSKVKATAYPTREWGGVIWVFMGPAELANELPQFEWARVPDDQRCVGKYVVEANYLQVLEGSLDSSHLGFLHTWLNNRGSTPPMDKTPRFFTVNTDFGVTIAARRNVHNDDDCYYWRLTQMLRPEESRWLVIRISDPEAPDGSANAPALESYGAAVAYSSPFFLC